jgi:site-specific DNA recombinase
VIYVRVSTQEQVVEGYSIQAQKDRLIAYCTAREWNIVDILVDGGYSGSNLDRPGMQKLIRDAKTNKFDVVLVYKLDRLSRSQKDTLYLIEDVILRNRVDFVSMNESFDTSSPFGRAMIGILSVFAQLEREQIKERMLMGRVERAKEGLFHGGGFVPIGYDYIDGQLVINEFEALQIKDIFDMYVNKGFGIERVRQELEIKYDNKHSGWTSHTSITNVLENQLYTGVIVFKDKISPGQHDAIISSELFAAAQTKRIQNKEINQKAFKRQALLSGFIFCKHCGGRYFLRSKSSDHKYYTCYSRAKNRPHMIKDPNCKNKIWSLAEMDEYVEAEIFKLAADKDYFYSCVEKPAEERDNKGIQKRLVEIEKQIEKLMELYQFDKIPIEQLSNKIDKLHNEKKELSQITDEKPREVADISGIEDLLAELPVIWEYSDLGERQQMLSVLIKQIFIDNDDIKIEWNF